MLLDAKVRIPRSDRPLLRRTRLLDALDPDAHLILMVAPAGSGKTALAISYVHTLARPVAWYSLGSGDSDPAVFLRYLIRSLAAVEPSIEDRLTPLVAAHLQSGNSAQAIADVINAALPPATLVLDDLHAIDQNGAMHEGIAIVLNALLRACPQLQIILASRAMPQMAGIVHVLARGKALIVNGPALDFTAAEIDQLCAQTTGAANEGEYDQLLASSGGWATAIALALRAHAKVLPQHIDDREVLYAYLANDVLHQLPTDLQQFILDTSLLEYMNAERCDYLRQRNDSAQFLQALNDRSLFVETTDDGMLRYQPLFRDFLLDQIRRQPEHYAALLRTAVTLAQQQGRLRFDWVFQLAVDAQAWDVAIDLVEDVGPQLRHTGQHATLLQWLDTIPSPQQTPALWRLRAQMLTDQGQLDEALVTLDRAAQGTNDDRMMAHVLRAQVLQQQGQLVEAAQIVAPFLDDEHLPAAWRARVLRLDGIIHARHGAYEAAQQRLQQALTLLQDTGDAFAIARLNQNLGVVERLRGSLDRAERYFRIADAHWKQLGADTRRCTTLNNLGMLLLERGRLADAKQQLTTALHLAQEQNALHAHITIRASLGDVAVANGALAEASARYTAAYTLATQHGYTSLAVYTLTQCVHVARLHHDRNTLIALLDDLETAHAQSPVEQAWLDGARAGTYWALNLPSAPDAIDQALAVLPPEEANDRAYLLLLRAQLLFVHDQAHAAWETWQELAAVSRRIASLHMFATWAQAVPQLLAQAAERSDLFAARLQLRINQALPTPPAEPMPAAAPATPPVVTDPDPAAPALIIRTLGAESIIRDGQPTNSGGPLTRAVFLCLLAAGTQGLMAETLRTRIWGDNEWSDNALKMAIKRVRRDICGVRFDGGAYALQLPHDIDYDVQHFLHLLQRPTTLERLHEAVALYKGPYVLRLEQPWAVGLRNNLAERYINAEVELAALLLQTDAAAASEHYGAALQADPYHANAVVGLMRAHAALGRRSFALDLYHEYTARINENGLDPDRAVEQTYRELLDDVG